MYKKTYIHLSSCMLNDDEQLFKHRYDCSESSFFKKVAPSHKIVDSFDHYGYPTQKVYDNNKHIMTYDSTQNTLFSSVIVDQL